MKLFIVLFLFIVVTCQAQQSPLRRRQIARQGDPEPSLNEQIYEKFKNLVKKYMIKLDPYIQAILVPAIYEADHLRAREPYKRPPGPLANNHVHNPTISQQYSNPTPSRFNNPAFQQQNSLIHPTRTNPALLARSLINKPTELLEVARVDQTEADREARLAQADKEALSKLSEKDKKLLENSLTPSEREALLVQLEEGKLDDLLPREENRFGGSGSAFSGAAAKIGSSAGSYIGHMLAGSLGAELGAAAGAYLGAAAASGFIKKVQVFSSIESEYVEFTTPQEKEYPYGSSSSSATYGFGAYKV